MSKLLLQYKQMKQDPASGLFSMAVSMKKELYDELKRASEESREAMKEVIEKWIENSEIIVTEKTEEARSETIDRILSDYEIFKEDLKASFREEVNAVIEETREEAKRIQEIKKGDPGENGKDGKDADEEVIVSKVLEKIIVPSPTLPDVNQIVSDAMTAHFIKNPVESLNKDALKEEIIVLCKELMKPEVLAESIARAIEALPYEKKLDYETGLKNKPGVPAYSQKSFRVGSKGGGMGDTQHESHDVSSATTSITLNFAIAGSGYAVWAYYQGQMIARGTHYTVRGDYKTIDLLFTPVDDTTIDLIYHKG